MSGSRMTYVSSLNKFYSFTGVNYINNQGNTFFLDIYADLTSVDFTGNAIFETSFVPPPMATVENCDIAADPFNQLIFVYLSQYTIQGGQGLLYTYDIAKNNTMLVNYGQEGRLKFSESRKVLFSAQIEDEDKQGLRVSSIEEVDPTTGKSRVLLNNTQMPEVYGLFLQNVFDDVSGEWFFVWTTTNQNSDASTATFFSVNVESKKVTQSTSLLYDDTRTTILGVAVADAATSTQQSHIAAKAIYSQQ